MKRFELNIKSHVDAPDYETIIFAENREEALNRAYECLHGEYSLQDIDKDMVEVKYETIN